MKRSTVVAANSNKSIFGQDGPFTGIVQSTQQTICRKLKNCYVNSLLQNTKNVSNILYSFLVTIFVVYLSNPQITKARSENFKSEIINFFGLCMQVGISEAIRLLSTCLLLITHSRVLYTTYNMATNINSVTSTDTINTNTSNSNDGSPKSTDGNYPDNKKFNE